MTFEVSFSKSSSSLLHKLPNNTDREHKVEIFQLANFALCFRLFVISIMLVPVFSVAGC